MTAFVAEEAVAAKGGELRRLAARLQADLEAAGAAVAPGFLTPGGLRSVHEETTRLASLAYRSVREPAGTVYVAPPDTSFPEGHPRRRPGDGASLGIVAHDQLEEDSPVRSLYEWEGLSKLVAAALGVSRVHRYADPLGAVNVTYMGEGDHLGWHFDQTDFVVSLAVSGSAEGGELESATRIRSADDEHYELVSAVLDGEADERLTRFAVVPGTLMLFQGRDSLHRVRQVAGDAVRCVVLFGFDMRPGTTSSEQLRLARYGRLGPPAALTGLRRGR